MRIYYEEIPDYYMHEGPTVTIRYHKSDWSEAQNIGIILGDDYNQDTLKQKKPLNAKYHRRFF